MASLGTSGFDGSQWKGGRIHHMRSPSAPHLQMLVSRIISSAVGHCCQRRCEIFRCNFDRQSFTRLLAHSSFIYIVQDAHSRGIGHRRAGFPCQAMETCRGPGNRQLDLLVTCKYLYLFTYSYTSWSKMVYIFRAVKRIERPRNNAMSRVVWSSILRREQ